MSFFQLMLVPLPLKEQGLVLKKPLLMLKDKEQLIEYMVVDI